MLYLKLSFEGANYLEFFYKKTNLRKGLLWHKKCLTGDRKTRLNVLKIKSLLAISRVASAWEDK